MQWEFMVALVLAMPIILLPVALLWYLNIGGILRLFRRRGREGLPVNRG